MSNQLSFEINGRKADLPLYTGSEGETAIDISKLRSQTGTITLDPGYVNTGATVKREFLGTVGIR